MFWKLLQQEYQLFQLKLEAVNLIQNNYNGFLVDRDIINKENNFLKRKSDLLIKMGNNNRSKLKIIGLGK